MKKCCEQITNSYIIFKLQIGSWFLPAIKPANTGFMFYLFLNASNPASRNSINPSTLKLNALAPVKEFPS